MQGRTHLLVGIAIAAAIAPTPSVAMAVVIGAMLPDIDHPQSLITGIVPGARLLSLGMRHRGVTHSLWALGLIVALGMTQGQAIGVGIGAGYASHLVLDMLTPRGVALFQPLINVPIGFMPRLLSPLVWVIEAFITVGAVLMIGAMLWGRL